MRSPILSANSLIPASTREFLHPSVHSPNCLSYVGFGGCGGATVYLQFQKLLYVVLRHMVLMFNKMLLQTSILNKQKKVLVISCKEPPKLLVHHRKSVYCGNLEQHASKFNKKLKSSNISSVYRAEKKKLYFK